LIPRLQCAAIKGIKRRWGTLRWRPETGKLDRSGSGADGLDSAAGKRAGPQSRRRRRPGRGGWQLTASYVEAFRPLLLDEAFTQGTFGRCLRFLLGQTAPASQICGGLYRPQVAYNTQASIAYAPCEGVVPGLQMDGRLTVFRSDVEATLESIQTVNGRITQPGTEQRNGLEFELNASYRWLFGSIAWSQIHGEAFDGKITTDLHDAPGDALVVQLGMRLLGNRLNVGWRYRRVDPRTAAVGVGAGSLVPGNRPVLGTQPGYEVNDVYAIYQAGPHLELRRAVENVFNESYYLDDGFGGGIASQAPGRNIKGAIGLQF
jgi:hemoglobin/transferrin/lactoferrin receptor protein